MSSFRKSHIVFKKNLAYSIYQARQFISHGHIQINNRKIDVPSYFVSREEESKIRFNPKSDLAKNISKEYWIKEETEKQKFSATLVLQKVKEAGFTKIASLAREVI